MDKPIILLADKSEQRSRLRELLTNGGYSVELAASAQEAKRKIQQMAIDLALVDRCFAAPQNKSDDSGLKVAEYARTEGVPCVIIDAYPNVSSARSALCAPSHDVPPRAVDYLSKTNRLESISETIQHHIDRFTVLHISDLHFGSIDDDKGYDQERSLRDLSQDLKRLKTEGKIGRVNAIIISGDIVEKGNEREFAAAGLFLDGLCRETKIEMGKVVLVPGNHDINRPKARKEWKIISKDDKKSNVLFPKFESYLDFTTGFYGEPAFTPRKLYRVFDFERVVIVAFNSCIREGNPLYKCPECQKEHYYGWIDKEQIDQAMKELQERFADRKALRLAVCHHHAEPKHKNRDCVGEHLKNYADLVKYRLAESGIRVLLHGHAHEAKLLQPNIYGTGMPCPFGSGTLLQPREPEKWESQYLILDLAPSGSHVIMRKYEPSKGERLGGWTADNSINIGGIVKLGIDLPAYRPSGS